MCDIREERMKLNQIYAAGAADLGRRKDLLFHEVVSCFLTRLQCHYQEFCSEACIEAKARDFAMLYCGQWVACTDADESSVSRREA